MNIWKRYSMRVSKNWVKFNKMFTLSPWHHLEEPGVTEQLRKILHVIAPEQTVVEVFEIPVV